MKKLIFIIALFFNFIPYAKANEQDDLISYCYSVYENAKAPEEVNKMRALLNRVNPDIYKHISSNPKFKKSNKNIDWNTQRTCVALTYNFLAEIQLLGGATRSSLKEDPVYCFGYMEKSIKALTGMVNDYCSEGEKDNIRIMACKKDVMDGFKKLPLFTQGFKDAKTINPLQFKECQESLDTMVKEGKSPF